MPFSSLRMLIAIVVCIMEFSCTYGVGAVSTSEFCTARHLVQMLTDCDRCHAGQHPRAAEQHAHRALGRRGVEAARPHGHGGAREGASSWSMAVILPVFADVNACCRFTRGTNRRHHAESSHPELAACPGHACCEQLTGWMMMLCMCRSEVRAHSACSALTPTLLARCR